MAAEATSGGGLLGFLGLGDLVTGLANSSFGSALGTSLGSRRMPDAADLGDPTRPTNTRTGAPGAVPTPPAPDTWAQIKPFAIAAGALLAVVLLVKLLFRR